MLLLMVSLAKKLVLCPLMTNFVWKNIRTLSNFCISITSLIPLLLSFSTTQWMLSLWGSTSGTCHWYGDLLIPTSSWIVNLLAIPFGSSYLKPCLISLFHLSPFHYISSVNNIYFCWWIMQKQNSGVYTNEHGISRLKVDNHPQFKDCLLLSS